MELHTCLSFTQTDSSLCEHLTLPGDVVNEASQGLLSAYDMCHGQGFTLVLDEGNSDVEGFYKFTTPLTFRDGRLESRIVCKFISVIFGTVRRLWYMYYAIAASPAEAKQAGLIYQSDVFRHTSTHDANFFDHSLFEGAAANHYHYAEQIYDECFTTFTANLPALFDTTLFDGAYKDEVDTSSKFWANELTGDLHDEYMFSAKAY